MTADPRPLAARGRRADWPNGLGYTLTTLVGEWDVWLPLGRDGCWVANFVPCGLSHVTWNGIGRSAAQAIQAAFEVLVEAYPNEVSRDALGEAIGYKRSSRDTYIQRLQARQLVTTQRNAVHASDELFR